MYEIVLFDFDFTLVDSSKGIIKSIEYALERLNYIVPSYEKIKETIGLPLKDAFVILSDTNNEKQYNLFKHYFMESSQKIMCDNTHIYPDTVCTLKQLREKNCKVAIVSAKDKKTIKRIARKYEFLDLIDMIVGENEVVNQKPNPEQVQMVLEILNIQNEKAVYIGDSLVDGYAAMNAKVDFVAVTTGTTSAERFLNLPSIGVAKSLEEAISFINF